MENSPSSDIVIPLLDIHKEEELDYFTCIDVESPRRRHAPKDSDLDAENSLGDQLFSYVHQYARDNNVKRLKEILSQHPDLLNKQDNESLTALHYAARYRNLSVVQLLLDWMPQNGKRRVDVNVKSNDELFTPLHFAARYYKKSNISDDDTIEDNPIEDDPTYAIILLLYKYGAEIDAADKYKLTPLHYAAMRSSLVATEALIKCGASIDLTDNAEMTPLMTACVHGADNVVKRLLECGAKIDKLDRRKNSVLHLAAQYGHANVLSLLLEKGGQTDRSMLRRVNSDDITPLQLAVERNHHEIVLRMLKILAAENSCIPDATKAELGLPHVAASKGYLNILRSLKEYRFDLNLPDDQIMLPLHKAAKHNHEDVVNFLLCDVLGKPKTDEEMKELDEYSESLRRDSIEKSDIRGMTPLLYTAMVPSTEAASVLLKYNADIYASDINGRSAVFIAAKYNNIIFLEWFLQHLKKLDEKNAERRNLKKKGRRITLRNFKFRTHVEDLVCGTDLDQSTPLHLAAANGYLEACKLLKNYGAREDALDEDKQTPLHLAAMKGHNPVVRQLLDWSPALAKATDDDGNSPLHLAAKNGNSTVCSTLLDRGADIATPNVFSQTALDMAVLGGDLQCARVLVVGGSNVNGDQYSEKKALHRAAEKGHEHIVSYLLECGAKIDALFENKTALDIALENDKCEVARALLQSDDWMLLMRRGQPMPLERHKEERVTPMRTLIMRFPDLAELVMNKCIRTTEHEDMVTSCNAVKNYYFELIEDTFMLLDEKQGKLVCTDAEGNGPYDETGAPRKDAQPYNKNNDRIYRKHPLKIMVDYERENLLSHPLVVALVKMKWNSIGRYAYYAALFIYVIFLTTLTYVLSELPAPFNVHIFDLDNKNGTFELIMLDSTANCTEAKSYLSSSVRTSMYVVQGLAIAQMLKECFQMFTRRLAYLSIENLIEICIYVSAFLVMLNFSECSKVSGIRLNWQWDIAAACIFLAYFNLLLLIRKLPRFGIFVLMVFDVVKTFGRFALIFLLFIQAFAVTFFLLMQNRPEFSTIFLSFLKTTVMMIGEMEFNGIFYGSSEHSEKLFTEKLTYIVFVLFCIIMTILLMNLLVGLAVDDIKSVQEKAEIKRLMMHVDLVLQVERSVSFLRTRKTRVIYASHPNKLSLWKKIRSRFGFNQIDSPVIASIQETEKETSAICRQLSMQRDDIAHLQSNIDYLYENQVHIGNMLRAIMTKLDNPQPSQ